MSRKTPSNSVHGFGDIIGVALLAVALLLLVAQWSFDHRDIGFLVSSPSEKNVTVHNWIGPFGAYLAWATFIPLGLVAYLLPALFALFGLTYLLNFPSHWRERLRWSLIWSSVLVVSLTGLLCIMSNAGGFKKISENIGSLTGAGGFLGFLTFGQTPRYEYGLSLLGTLGATIVYLAFCLISLLFLTKFRLGEWIRGLLEKMPTQAEPEPESTENIALERRARELEKQAKKLQEEVARTGLGADMQPVPEPTVRDLSVPQAKPAATTSARIRKTTLPGGVVKEPVMETENPAPLSAPKMAPAAEPEIVPEREVAVATTEDIIGRKSEADKTAETKIAEPEKIEPEKEKPADPVVHIADGSVPAKPKAKPKKPKPLTVAATPIIGNYQLPPLDFLQHPDTTIKPTESKEELMANARLMQQTLAQFDIEVSLGDITKGPTITRYELHPAPGVKLEKITALSNNIAAALKAERIHILAPVPGKSSVGVEVPNPVKT